MQPEVIYQDLCSVCSGSIDTNELNKGICSKKNVPLVAPFEIKEFEEFEKFFEEKTKFKLKSIQRYWAKKLLYGLSFTATAPTGVGKTLFGIVFSSFISKKGKKCYFIVPTTLLLKQGYEKLTQIADTQILAFLPEAKKKEKELFFEKLENKEFDILLTTAAFLSKHFDKLKHLYFDFIFVDDVDAVLKASKNVDRLLFLLGFSKEEISSLTPEENKPHGQIMVSTATAKPGKKAILFSRLLEFTVGLSRSVLRNIDEYAFVCNSEEEKLKVLVEVIKSLGYGGIIFTPTENDTQKIYEYISQYVPSAVVTSSLSKKEIKESIENFLEKKVDVLIGVSASYGILTRGIDYPLHIKYAVFYKIPQFKVGIKEIEEATPKFLLMLASIFKKDEVIEANLPYIGKKTDASNKVKEALKRIFNNKEFDKATGGIVVKENQIIIPDISTYIQASGRTSRMYAGGITKGASFILDEKEFVEAFTSRAIFYDLKIETKTSAEITQIDFGNLKNEIETTRKHYQTSMGTSDPIKPVLFIVESPTKAKQIARFFGTPSMFKLDGQIIYEVATGTYVLLTTASLGHVTDLVENEAYYGVKLENGKFIPIYGSIKKCNDDNVQFVGFNNCPRCGKLPDYDSKIKIQTFWKAITLTENAIIATDPDTEGEKIAFDIKTLTSVLGNVKRAEFHEVTRNAILHALQNLREVNENMVKAQIIRRIEDRWIGFELSRILQEKFNNKNLSAGRAQTPVLSWIINRYKEYKQKIKLFILKVDDNWIELGREDEVSLKIDKKTEDVEVIIEKLDEIEEERNPLPPYSTDAVLKDINRFLKINTKEIMRILQDLFENGLITYHRTNSNRVSDKGLEIAKQFLKENFVKRSWETEEKGAHECIRPTRPFDWKTIRDLISQEIIIVNEPLTKNHYRVYDFIFRRFMASQSPKIKVKIEKYIHKIPQKNFAKELTATVKAEGLAYELYPYTVQITKPYPLGVKNATLTFVSKPKSYLFTQADVISEMKEKGIGRASTYASILDRLFIRHYILERKSILIPTSQGIKIEQFLKSHFEEFISEARTRLVEKLMDEVEQGEQDYIEVLKEFYEETKKAVEKYEALQVDEVQT